MARKTNKDGELCMKENKRIIQESKDIMQTMKKNDWNSVSYTKQAVKQDGMLLKHVAVNLREGNRAVVRAAVRENGLALQFAGELFQGDKEFVLDAVSQNGMALQYANDILKNDKECVLKAVSQNGMALQYANDILKNDKECVLKAVSQNGMALQFASDVLNNEMDIVDAATRQNPDARHFKTRNSILRYCNKISPLWRTPGDYHVAKPPVHHETRWLNFYSDFTPNAVAHPLATGVAMPERE